jgi:hypothetical protein
VNVAEAAVDGILLLRDGIPLFDPTGCSKVNGFLLWFKPGLREPAWDAISAFEPSAQYTWTEVDAPLSGDEIRANTLKGRKPKVGTAMETVETWSASADPVFDEGLEQVRRLVLEVAPDGINPRPDDPDFWQIFFRLQSAYLLLWSAVERYTAFRFGPTVDPMERLRLLKRDPTFLEAVRLAEPESGMVVDSRDPETKYHVTPDGGGKPADYYYQVRSNLSHRGKSAWQDAVLVYKAVTELHDIMAYLLARTLPVREIGPLLSRRAHEGGDL